MYWNVVTHDWKQDKYCCIRREIIDNLLYLFIIVYLLRK